MSTLKEVESQLRKTKKELREIKKENEELKLREKFYQDRLEIAHEKNAILREEKRNITVDDVIAFQKVKADYASSQDQSLAEQLEKQEKVEFDSKGIAHEKRTQEP
jgi:hypothetical protein